MIHQRIGALLLFTSILGVTTIISAEHAFPSTPPALPATKLSTTDFHGDPLPRGAVARLGTIRLFHEYGTNVAFSADGKILASAGGGIHLWDATTGRELREFPGSRGFALSPDGTRLASMGPEWSVVQIWDTSNGKVLHQLRGHGAEVFTLCFSPNGKLLATGGSDGRLYLWDAVNGTEIKFLTSDPLGRIASMAFSRDGRTLISGEWTETAAHEKMTRLWEVASGKERRRFPGQTFVSLSPDGQVMAMTRDNGHTLQLVKLLTGETLLTIKDFPGEGPPRDINWATVAPDGKVLATACRRDHAIRLWDARNGQALRSIPLPGYAFSVAFAPNGKTLAVGIPWTQEDAGRVRLFDPATGAERILQPGHQTSIHSIRFLDSTTMASIGADKKVCVWQTSGKLIREWTLPNVPLAISPDGKLVAAPGLPENLLELHDTSTGKLRHKLAGHRNGSGQPAAEVVTRVAFTSDGTRLAADTESGDIFLWNFGKEKMESRWAAAWPTALAISGDGETVVSGHWDCTLRLWDARSGRLLRVLGKPREKSFRLVVDRISSVAFAPHGKSIAAAESRHGENVIHVWDLASGKELGQFQGHPPSWREGWINTIAFSPDGKTLFSASVDKTVRLWDMATGKERRRLEGHRASVSALAVSPDGTRLASASKDCTVLIWDVQ